MLLQPPPIRTPLIVKDVKDKDVVHWGWLRWFQQVGIAIDAPVDPSAPATSTSPTVQGAIAFDQNFLYIAIGANQWKRIPLTAF